MRTDLVITGTALHKYLVVNGINRFIDKSIRAIYADIDEGFVYCVERKERKTAQWKREQKWARKRG